MIHHPDPSLYPTAATVIPVFWLGLIYQANAYDLTGKKGSPFALGSLVVVTLAAIFGEINAFGALFDRHLAGSARQPVAWGLYLPGVSLFALPAWRLLQRGTEGTIWGIVIWLAIIGAMVYGAVYVPAHVGR